MAYSILEEISKKYKLVILKVNGNGSCFFNSIFKSLTGYDDERSVQKLRYELSLKIKHYYNMLSRGELLEFSKSVNTYSLENMQKELNSYRPVDTSYLELVSDLLNKDIYIIKNNEFLTLDESEFYYKGRDSIIITYSGDGDSGHYDSVGVIENEIVNNIGRENIKTLFSKNHEISKLLYRYMKNIQK